ncbi:MAG TPA: SDR family oxidoreductase [Gammaproteobacteria bacterium]|jgi:NAD(P)-dependent dehydrogenase (short-subunit alcohol dehydrogenase family)|nr:SDR family oxidoreductase [Gammaproteobacteria bacterium]HIK72216.1 SDR family oxidoreductase [Gammaproteobacteria bacterium]
MDKLEGKVAIITGGAGGIGKAAANTFISEGAEVIIMDLDEDSLIKTCEEIGSNRISYFVGDVTKPDDNNNIVELAKERYGGLDIFLANAGVAGDITTIEEYDEDQFDHVMAVNAKGPFLGLQSAIPAMKLRGGGSFIITSSTAGVMGTPSIAPYGMSKHAVIGLMKSAAKECASMNIRVNTVNPAPVETDMMRLLEEGMTSEDKKDVKADIESSIPLGRYAQPEEIAKLMLFLASEDSSFITGSVYMADGGSSS